MANTAAFEMGWQSGERLAAERRERKEQLADEERQTKVADLYSKRNQLALNVPSLGVGSPERLTAMDRLANIENEISAIYHPTNNPGALQKDWHWLRGLITGKRGQTAPPVLSKTTEPGTPQETLTMPSSGPVVTFPGTKQTIVRPPASGIGPEQSFDVQTPPSTVSAPEQALTLAATPPVTTAVSANEARMSPQQRELWARQQAAKKAADEDVVALGGLSPEQQMEATMSAADRLMGKNWNADERERFRQGLLYAATGITAKEKYFPQIITTKDESGQEHYYRVPQAEDAEPEEIDFSGQKMVPKTTVKPKGLKYDQLTGQVVDQDTTHRYSLKDVGKPGSPPELLDIFNGAKDMMDKKQQNALALANQRGLSLAQNRYGSFIDPDNPTEVIPVPFGEAARRGLHLAVGAQYQTMTAMLKSATSGPIGNEIVAYSTALQHADLLEQAAANLNNPDVRVLARISNDLATQFGDESPTDFNVIANAYTREVTKALTSGHVTDNELRENGATIPRDASPQQILGAVRAYRNLMQSKIKIRTDQIAAGMAGTPYLGAQPAATGGAAPKGGARPGAAPLAGTAGAGSKGPMSIAKAMKMWQDKGQPKTEPWVINDLQKHNYIPVRP